MGLSGGRCGQLVSSVSVLAVPRQFERARIEQKKSREDCYQGECRSVFIQEKASIQRRWPQGEWMPYRRWLEFWLTPESSGGLRTGESAECKMPRVDQVWYCTPVILRDEVGKNTSSRPSWATQQESISKKTNTSIQECSVPWWKLTAHQKTWSQYKVVPKRCCLIPVSKTLAPQGCMSFCCFLYRIAVMPLSVPKLKIEWVTHHTDQGIPLRSQCVHLYWMFTCLQVRYPKGQDKRLSSFQCLLSSAWVPFPFSLGPNHWNPLGLK